MEEIIQGSEAWHLLRIGKVTASRIADVLSKGRNGAESAGVRNYRSQLVCERLTGAREETYINAAMMRGTELEPLARECYEFIKGVEVNQTAFVDHPTVLMSGCSPDGLTNDDGLIEIKCPNTATHIDYLLNNVVPSDYIPQMMWQMACTGRKYCDFVSYDNRLPENMQLFIKRLERDNAKIAEIETAVIEFNSSVNKMIESLKAAVNEP